MLIRSLSHFGPSTGKRAEQATAAVRRILFEQGPLLRRICAAAFAMQLVPLLLPILLREFLPTLLRAPESNSPAPGTFAGGSLGASFDRSTLLWCLAGAASAIGIIRAGANYLFLKWAGQCGHRFVASFRDLAYAHLMRLPVRYVERRGGGRILLRFIGDTDALRSWLSRTGPKLIADVVAAAIICAAMLWLSIRLTLVFVVPLTAMSACVLLLSRFIRNQTRESRRLQSQLTGYVAQRLTAIRAAKSIDAHRGARHRFQELVAQVSEQNSSRDRSAALLESGGQMAVFIAFPLVLLVGFPQTWSGETSAGDFLAFVWLALHLITLLRVSLAAIVVHQKALVSIQRLHALLSRSAERGRGSKAGRTNWWPIEITTALSDADGLDPASLDSSRQTAEVIVCYGPGVCELPSLIDEELLFGALLGFARWPHGSLRLGNVEIDRIDVERRRRGIFYLAAEPFLTEGTLAENLFLYRRAKSRNNDVVKVTGKAAPGSMFQQQKDCHLPASFSEAQLLELSLLRLPPSCQFKPSDLDMPIRANGHGLSSWQRRQIAIHQALLAKPQILLVPRTTVQSWTSQDLAVVIETIQTRATVLIAVAATKDLRKTGLPVSTYTPADLTTIAQ